jgi:hypothetical protein
MKMTIAEIENFIIVDDGVIMLCESKSKVSFWLKVWLIELERCGRRELSLCHSGTFGFGYGAQSG